MTASCGGNLGLTTGALELCSFREHPSAPASEASEEGQDVQQRVFRTHMSQMKT